MKKRWIKAAADAADAPGLFEAVARLRSAEEARALLVDLCTPAELEALSDRWRVVPHLLRGVPYREIHDLTAVSVTTIGRVARCLTMGEGGYQTAARRLGLVRAAPSTPAQPGALLRQPSSAPGGARKAAPRGVERKGRPQ